MAEAASYSDRAMAYLVGQCDGRSGRPPASTGGGEVEDEYLRGYREGLVNYHDRMREDGRRAN